MRQGEMFGLGVEDLDLDGGWVHVRRQVKRVRSRLVFGLPKNDRDRKAPLPELVAQSLTDHLATYPPVAVTLPWEDPAGKLVTVRLVFTTPRRNALNRSTMDLYAWRPALRGADIMPDRSTGMHALRHFYASALLDAGESIKAVAEHLGHSDPGFTLRVYTHLMPAGDERTRRTINKLFGGLAKSSDGPLEG